MRTVWIIICTAAAAAGLHAGAFDADLEYSVPSESGSTKYFGTLKKGTAVVLTVTVRPDPGWEFADPAPACTKRPADIKMTGNNPWTFTVPKTLAEGKYVFTFRGFVRKRKQGSSSGNGDDSGNSSGGNDEDKQEWNVTSVLYINDCDYEDSGKKGKCPVTLSKGDLKHRDVDLEPVKPNRMKDLDDLLEKPEAGAYKCYEKFSWGFRGNGKTKCPECKKACFHFDYMPSMEIEYHIMMPRWEQCNKAGQDAQQEWSDFYNALLVHENGHVQIIEEFYGPNGEARNSIAKKYWGEAHNEERAKILAERPMKEDLQRTTQTHANSQMTYDDPQHTDHGKKQKTVDPDAENVRLDLGIPLWPK